jgi:hypothetical protein
MPRSLNLRRLSILLALLVISGLVAACGGGTAPAGPDAAPTTTPAKVATTQAPAVTAVAQATLAPEPTTAAPPTVEPSPTAAPEPTQEPAPTSAPEPTATAQEAAPGGQAALDLFLAVAKAQAAQKSMRMTMTSEQGGTASETVMELVRPDRLRSSGGPGGDMVIVPEGTYMKPAGGAWQKAPFNMSDGIGEMLSQASVEEMMKNITVEKLRPGGAALVNGKPCWIYEFEQTIEVMNQKVESKAKIWVGIGDKLPYKSVAESESSAEPGVVTTTTILYEYGGDLQIEAPIP